MSSRWWSRHTFWTTPPGLWSDRLRYFLILKNQSQGGSDRLQSRVEGSAFSSRSVADETGISVPGYPQKPLVCLFYRPRRPLWGGNLSTQDLLWVRRNSLWFPTRSMPIRDSIWDWVHVRSGGHHPQYEWHQKYRLHIAVVSECSVESLPDQGLFVLFFHFYRRSWSDHWWSVFSIHDPSKYSDLTFGFFFHFEIERHILDIGNAGFLFFYRSSLPLIFHSLDTFFTHGV